MLKLAVNGLPQLYELFAENNQEVQNIDYIKAPVSIHQEKLLENDRSYHRLKKFLQ